MQSYFESPHDMAGAMPGEDLYLSASGITTRQIPGQLCGTYISHDGAFVSYWANLVIKHPGLLFRGA